MVWPQDRACDRKWLLENVEGAIGLVVMLTDKVDHTRNPHTSNRTADQMEKVDEELLAKGLCLSDEPR